MSAVTMNDQRPDPDALLARVQAEEAKQARGKLKIFFGAAPGVGKTYAMLEAGRKAAKEGVDVLVGYVEPHVRPETQALVLGLDVLPRKEVPYRGTKLVEFDLEAALAKRPAIDPRRRTGPYQRPGHDARQALAGRDATARGRHRRLHHAQRPAPRKPQRRRRADHRRRRSARRCPTRSSSRPTRSNWSTCRPTTCWSGCARARSTSPSRPSGRSQNFFSKGNLIALRELALRRSGRARRRADGGLPRGARRGAARGRPASGCWCASAPARSPAGWCGPRGGWRPV